ncbi:saccharopine dehydrogenase C-terminal domain-containing protein [Terrimonas sp. R1]
MKQIMLFGAGKSATVLIDYLLANAKKEKWHVTVADANLQLAIDKINDSPFGTPVSFDIMDGEQRRNKIAAADIVISMLPPVLHSEVAQDCVHFSKHLLTASYVDEHIQRMKTAIADKQLIFLCEMGLDPGIDHMSAMKIIDEIHAKGGKIISFKSHCGGLVAPESDDNPWHYKISWNPRNIVMAGKAGAVYKQDNEVCKVPYEKLFDNDEMVTVPGLGDFAFYPNRDSLSYIPVYCLNEAATFIRTTLRHPAFCKAWNYVVKAALTDEEKSAVLTNEKNISFKNWLDKTIALRTDATGFDDFLNRYVPAKEEALIKKMFAFIGLLSDDRVPSNLSSAADVMQYVLENNLALQPHDSDMIVMLHEFVYEINGVQSSTKSSLVVKGENSLHTAMAKTVGLPLGIAAKLILNGTIKTPGLHIPTIKEIYEPVLKELQLANIKFDEQYA